MSAYRSLFLRLGFLVVLVAGIMFLASAPVHADQCTSKCDAAFAQCETNCDGNGQCLSNCRAAHFVCLECCQDPNCNPGN